MAQAKQNVRRACPKDKLEITYRSSTSDHVCDQNSYVITMHAGIIKILTRHKERHCNN